MQGEGVQDRRAPGRRTSSLHRDVRFLACPELLCPAANATYGAPQRNFSKAKKIPLRVLLEAGFFVPIKAYSAAAAASYSALSSSVISLMLSLMRPRASRSDTFTSTS